MKFLTDFEALRSHTQVDESSFESFVGMGGGINLKVWQSDTSNCRRMGAKTLVHQEFEWLNFHLKFEFL